MRSSITALLLVLVAATPALIPMVVAAPSGHGFLSTRGTSIIDSTGRAITLHGVNYPGYEAPQPLSHSPTAYFDFAKSGFNVVRLQISWANLEPTPGVLNVEFLTWRIDQDVAWARLYGVYIILDMHQFDWAGKFGGQGAPEWSVQGYPANEVGLRQAVSRFWADPKLQDHFLSVWTMIARHYANEPTIAGYDILNEPWVYTTVNSKVNATSVSNFYARAVQDIRRVDQNHIIFLEPANLNTFNLTPTMNIVWSPHFYQLAFVDKYYAQNFTLLQADIQAKYQEFVVKQGAPMWIGEFGQFISDKPSGTKWTQDAMNLFAKYQIGWAWWAYTGNSVPSVLVTS